MKKTIITIAFALTLLMGVLFTGCKSPAQKEDAAQEDVTDAREDLNSAKKDANNAEMKVATAEEWTAFKIESEGKIKDNEIRIAELRARKNKPGKTFDKLYEARIETLEQKNMEMRTRIDTYENSQSDWESFKREFNHDMDELGKSLKDITVDNKN